MDNRLLPGLLLSALSLACIIIILTAFRKVVVRSGMDKKQGRSLFIKVLLAVTGWVLLLAILSIEGFFKDFSGQVPRPGLVISIPVIILLFLSFSKRFTALLQF